MPSDAAGIEQACRASYERFQYVFVDFVAGHLAETSRAFRGDMQQVVLLAIVGQVHLRARMEARAAGLAVAALPLLRRGITTFRLADASGIPRETARRKLQALAERGWVTREGRFWLLDEARAAADLAGLDARNLARAARFIADMRAMLAGPAPPDGTGPGPA